MKNNGFHSAFSGHDKPDLSLLSWIKENVVVILVLFLACLLIAFNVLLFRDKGDLNAASAGQSDSTGQYQGRFIDLLQNDGLSLDGLIIQRQSDKAVMSLEELFESLGDTVLFVCRISVLNCSDCVDYAIEKAVELAEKSNGRMKFAVWGLYESLLPLDIIRNNHPNTQKCCDYYLVPLFDIPMEERGYPYFFTIDRTLTVKDVFSPSSSEPVKTDVYGELISSKWK